MRNRDGIAKFARPKLRVGRSYAWPQHRDGWKHVERLVERHLACPDGTLFVSAVEEHFHNHGAIEEPWVGVIHQVPHHNLRRYPDLARLIESEVWLRSVPFCRGLWTLSNYAREFLLTNGVRIPVCVLPYATSSEVPQFDWDRFVSQETPRLLHVGEFQRNFQSFYDLHVPGWRKQLLIPPKWPIHSRAVVVNESVELVPRVSDVEYDALLQESVVFVDLIDAPANTVIVECLARATPICVNNVGGVAEYLGEDYPLYHNGNADGLLTDFTKLRLAHDYLLERRKRVASDEEFLRSIRSSVVYLSLPTPQSQLGQFRRFDLTVLIESGAKIESLRPLLTGLAMQENAPDFEIVIWNNGPNDSRAVAKIVEGVRPHLSVRTIIGCDNIHGGLRFALPALARSDVLLVCGDSVAPHPTFVRTLFDAHRRLGTKTMVCVRGHLLRPHRLEIDSPESAWQTESQITFLDESMPATTVDFGSGDCVIASMHLFRHAASYPMTHPEYRLVDDYWMCQVLGARMGVKIYKIQASDILHFSNCDENGFGDDPLVHEQRVRLYIEHMLTLSKLSAAEPAKVVVGAKTRRSTAPAVTKGPHR